MCLLLKVVIVAAVINLSLAKIVPDYITICPGLTNDCLKNSIQAAIPEFSKGNPSLGIRTIDPLRDDNVSLKLPGDFKVQFINGTMTGLRKCIVEDVSMQNDEGSLTLRCNITLRGQYKANGQILIVSINGDGDAKIRTTDIVITAKIKFEDKVRDGKTYYEIKQSKISHKFAGRISFSLTNLFRGNPEISEAVLQFLNQNWRQITEEFGGPIFDRVESIIIDAVKAFFHNVPKDEIVV